MLTREAFVQTMREHGYDLDIRRVVVNLANSVIEWDLKEAWENNEKYAEYIVDVEVGSLADLELTWRKTIKEIDHYKLDAFTTTRELVCYLVDYLGYSCFVTHQDTFTGDVVKQTKITEWTRDCLDKRFQNILKISWEDEIK